MMYEIFTSPNGETIIVLEQDGVRICFVQDEQLPEYQRYLAWLAEGNEPEVIEP